MDFCWFLLDFLSPNLVANIQKRIKTIYFTRGKPPNGRTWSFPTSSLYIYILGSLDGLDLFKAMFYGLYHGKSPCDTTISGEYFWSFFQASNMRIQDGNSLISFLFMSQLKPSNGVVMVRSFGSIMVCKS